MAQQKKAKLPIDILIKHLYFHKDAVIILGPDILGECKQFEITEETYDSYNRKQMIKLGRIKKQPKMPVRRALVSRFS